MEKVSCVIPTKDRYKSLQSCLQSIIQQSVMPNEIHVYDDSKNPQKLTENEIFLYLSKLAEKCNCKIHIHVTSEIGQTINHNSSLTDCENDLIWRIDCDELAEPDVLETLLTHMSDPKVGAVGGLVINPNNEEITDKKTQTIAEFDNHIQMFNHKHTEIMEVEHLYSSFLYRKEALPNGYCIMLNKCGFREETIATYEMFINGYKLLVDPNAYTWHCQNSSGGMRTYIKSDYEYNDILFNEKRKLWKMVGKNDLVILDISGKGDSICLRLALEEIIKDYSHIYVGTPHSDIWKNLPSNVSVIEPQQAKLWYNSHEKSIYHWMRENDWNQSVIEAYIKKYKKETN
ncbi:MAG: glycosyltransferase family 2 protein [Candidatus Heimdallarchaeaceae archaeon]